MTARTLTPFDPDVVRPWTVGEGRRGVLLVHGFAGTPPELRRLGDHLAGRGFRCQGILLAGHGATAVDLERTTRHDWLASARAELDLLAQTCDEVMVTGQSMGGTVALALAATDLRVTAVATLAAPVFLSTAATLAIPVVKRVLRWQRPGQDVDLFDPEAIEELYSLGIRPMRAIAEFARLIGEVRDQLALVRAPTLVLHGGRDRTIDPTNAAEIAARLVCSASVRRHLFPRSGHAMSVDVDRDAINTMVGDWFELHTAASPRPARRA